MSHDYRLFPFIFSIFCFPSISFESNALGLVSKCKYYSNSKYEYKDFFKLSDIRGSQPKGYQARIEFYAQGTRNAHIVLSATDRPNLQTDNLYEFVIGGWQNSRVLIRRKKSEELMTQVFVFHTMTPNTPTKFVIEVAHSKWDGIKIQSAKSMQPSLIPFIFCFCRWKYSTVY